MRKKLKLLTLAIACALLYDGCKPDDPEVITTITVELTDFNTQQPVSDIGFYIQVDKGKGNFLYSVYDTIDSARTDATGKFTKVFSSNKIGKAYVFVVYPDYTDVKWRQRLKYSQIICEPFIDLCYDFYPGRKTTLKFYAY